MNKEFRKKMAILKEESTIKNSSNGTLVAAAILANVGPSAEWDLICFMQQNKLWINRGIIPTQPANYKPGLPIEFGLFLYWIFNPPSVAKIKFKVQIAEIVNELKNTYGIKSTQMISGNYNILGSTKYSLIYHDGSVLSTEKYAAYDVEWFVAFFTLYQTVTSDNGNGIFYNGVSNFPIASPPIAPIIASGSNSKSISIAIVGDWGTGDVTAGNVMNQITALNPDYIVHLGDVYYAGAPAFGDPNSQDYLPLTLNEEVNNLIKLWPKKYYGKSFTLNSKHEMYSGANGYFYNAMGVNAIPSGNGSPFSAQKGYSYFAVKFGDWTLLGLDSAFMSSVFDGFTNGSIGGSSGAQGKWIKSLKLDPDKTIVLTHHNGINYQGTSIESLWTEIATENGALGGDPFAWYWGNIHNAFAFNSPLSLSNISSEKTISTKTNARCIGHGALPFGFANGVTNVKYQADSNQFEGKLYNGFVLLTLELSKEKVTNITEGFYDQNNFNHSKPEAKTTPVWKNVIYKNLITKTILQQESY